MTFYNIIFGLLFLGAIREVAYYSLDSWHPTRLAMAATLAVLIFSDTIFTSTVIEDMRKRYHLKMKFMDLANFILLTTAVVLVNPHESDLFEIQATHQIASVVGIDDIEGSFWCLLGIYMAVLFAWNLHVVVRKLPPESRWLPRVQIWFAVLLLGMALGCWHWAVDPQMLRILRTVIFFASVAYLCIYKYRVCRVLSEPSIKLDPLEPEHEEYVEQWSKSYTGYAEQLNYALKPDTGWLAAFKREESNFRYGIWHNDVLCGFTLLITKASGKAEFYIALKPEMTGQGLGEVATHATLREAFKQHEFDRVELRVRHWYREAQDLYAKCGFRYTDQKPERENIDGYEIEFIFMEARCPFHLRAKRWLRAKRRGPSPGAPSLPSLYQQNGAMDLVFPTRGIIHVRYPLPYLSPPTMTKREFRNDRGVLSIRNEGTTGFDVIASAPCTDRLEWTVKGKIVPPLLAP